MSQNISLESLTERVELQAWSKPVSDRADEQTSNPASKQASKRWLALKIAWCRSVGSTNSLVSICWFYKLLGVDLLILQIPLFRFVGFTNYLVSICWFYKFLGVDLFVLQIPRCRYGRKKEKERKKEKRKKEKKKKRNVPIESHNKSLQQFHAH